jgi:hypothetical protein
VLDVPFPDDVTGHEVPAGYKRIGSVTQSTVNSVWLEVRPFASDLDGDNEVGSALRDPYRHLLEDKFPLRFKSGPLQELDIGSEAAALATWNSTCAWRLS